jgi:hypothetical protein
MMGLYTESVSLALKYNLIEKAKDYAKKPEDEEKKKKLWMMVFNNYISLDRCTFIIKE